eukprot:2657489-Rhodomonas_salina.1
MQEQGVDCKAKEQLQPPLSSQSTYNHFCIAFIAASISSIGAKIRGSSKELDQAKTHKANQKQQRLTASMGRVQNVAAV